MGFVKDHDFCYDSSELLALRPHIVDFDEFAFDIRDIDMIPQGENYALGIQRYYQKQDVPAKETGLKSILQKQMIDSEWSAFKRARQLNNGLRESGYLVMVERSLRAAFDGIHCS